MGQEMEIEIMEVYKSKKYYILIFDLIFKCVKLPKFWFGLKIQNLYSIFGVLVENLNGGADKVELLVACNLDHFQQKSSK